MLPIFSIRLATPFRKSPGEQHQHDLARAPPSSHDPAAVLDGGRVVHVKGNRLGLRNDGAGSIELERPASAESTTSAASADTASASLHSLTPVPSLHSFQPILATLDRSAFPATVPRVLAPTGNAATVPSSMSPSSLSSPETSECVRTEPEAEAEDGHTHPVADPRSDTDALALVSAPPIARSYELCAVPNPFALAREHDRAPVVPDMTHTHHTNLHGPFPVYHPALAPSRALLGPELEPCVSVVSVASVASETSLTSLDMAVSRESPSAVFRPLIATMGPKPRFYSPQPAQRKRPHSHLPKSALRSEPSAHAPTQTPARPLPPPPSERFLALPLPTHPEIPARTVRFAPHATYLTITEDHAPAWVRRSVRTARPVRDDRYTLSMRRDPEREEPPVLPATSVFMASTSTRSMLLRPASPPPTPTEVVMAALGEPLHRVRCKEPPLDTRSTHERASPEPHVPVLAKARAWFTRHRPRRLAAA